MEEILFKCSNCGNQIEQVESVCLVCESMNKTIVVNFIDSVKIKNQLSAKVKDYSKSSEKRVVVKFTSGSEQSNNGNWVEKEFLIDKKLNIYFEKVADEKGNTIHFCSEKLTDHMGHGSAKFRKKN